MSAPRIKRPFTGAAADPSQRQITSFFDARSPNDIVFETCEPRQPTLPSTVQSNLLSVGMRIRKSVPEGYKTTNNGFQMWTDNKPLSSSPSVAATSASRSASRELLPFCGINRVGGLDSQPDFRIEVEEEEEGNVPALDAVPELTLSQESTDSVLSVAQPNESNRKRFYDEDDNDDPARPWSRPKAWDEAISPRSFAPVGWGNARVMAVPRSRMKKTATTTTPLHCGDVDDQENMVVDGDFEEADFLVFGGGSEMDTTG